jgi:hypothetical protein
LRAGCRHIIQIEGSVGIPGGGNFPKCSVVFRYHFASAAIVWSIKDFPTSHMTVKTMSPRLSHSSARDWNWSRAALMIS